MGAAAAPQMVVCEEPGGAVTVTVDTVAKL